MPEVAQVVNLCMTERGHDWAQVGNLCYVFFSQVENLCYELRYRFVMSHDTPPAAGT